MRQWEKLGTGLAGTFAAGVLMEILAAIAVLLPLRLPVALSYVA